MDVDHRAQVLQAIDIVELISQTVALKRRGKDYLGLCPFHQEKTPSFYVSPGKQTFYCFGCKAGGTVFDFVMKRDRVEFRESLEILARQAGIELPQFNRDGQSGSQRQSLLESHTAACRFFEDLLWNENTGAAAREYLKRRGFNDETLHRFNVGLAVDSWDALLKGPVGHKFGAETLLAAGLVKAREGGNGFYDTFRNRIMFPIRDTEGKIIAFGGRVVPGSEDPAKYLNSPETALFNKGRSIFGLNFARQKIVETCAAVITEGYTDVVMAHQFGASNVVSVLGTAMTEQHVAVLRRFADRIVLLFDADAAGNAAVDRVVQLFLTQPVEIAVASMPAGMDPDEYLLKYGADEFVRMLTTNASDALSYAWKLLSSRYKAGSDDLTAQQKALEEYVELLAAARSAGSVDSLRWGPALARVSKLTGMPVEELHKRLGSRKSTPKAYLPKVAEAPEPTEATPVVQPAGTRAKRSERRNRFWASCCWSRFTGRASNSGFA